jgi:hypothetical protein
VDCGEGWWPIIAQLEPRHRRDRIRLRSAPDQGEFGGVRFYYAGGTGNDARIDELIAQAERVAAQTCELCGALAVPAAQAGSGRCATGMPKAASTFSRSNVHRSIRRRSEQVPARGR